ncbi:MAG: hypothetical protein IJJ69_00870 [Oscillospiraceae bacterium]|nr:hypothetical protein [Oscillospiraceae bacterium]
MNKIKRKTFIIVIGILLLIVFLFFLVYEAILTSAPLNIEPLEGADYATETTGDIRTDAVLCFQREGDSKYLLNLSYQKNSGWLDIYPAQPLEAYDIRPGDFAEMTYQAEYSVGGEDGHHQSIKQLGDFSQIYAPEALSKRNLQSASDIWHTVRQADGYPVRIYQNQASDFVMIPAEDKFYLFRSDSDKPVIFDDYRQVTKDIEIHGEIRQLRTWVLCNDGISDAEILETLYQGTVSDNSDFFFVGYDWPYPFQFTANGEETEHLYTMQKYFLPADAPESGASHFMAQELENPEVFTALPVAVQQTLVETWNHEDDVIIFGGNYGEACELSFDDNNLLCLTAGAETASGYVLIYLESGFFENICSGIALDN